MNCLPKDQEKKSRLPVRRCGVGFRWGRPADYRSWATEGGGEKGDMASNTVQ
jgi:hypothetical protein